MKCCMGVTFYNPTASDINKISYYLKSMEKIYIYDNTEGGNLKNIWGSSVEIISSGYNYGLSKAFNEILKKAKEENFDFTCLMDQDSEFKIESIEKIINFIKQNKDEKIAIYCPEIIYKGSDNQKKMNFQHDYLEWAITSGSFINMEFEYHFDENYFIDRVDIDFCTEILKQGRKILRVGGSFLYQSLGEECSRKGRQHNAMRNYYIFRNRLYFYKKQKSLLNIKLLLASLKQILEILLFENDKINKLKMIFRGFSDFVKKRMGKYEVKDIDCC